MSNEVWKRDEVESPCINICVIHPQERICTGCLRSIDEITDWGRMTPDARKAVMAELPTRAPLLKKRRGGRAARKAG
ncbi:DUF1289 domain-containing protein [Parasulfitobacter algicola]|uniref:DUF1289 domain-containing protein n=1 Tax=Parasulfitobacter algicola TaxID=2614809 RepID=A0ABX2ITY7_9RHOB|nr:DUF1289 domain-containing protein [Sulfitobacter algicola]NSX56373.1 DUF1289 domain-containing protein [Sulfitobacter algicola]